MTRIFHANIMSIPIPKSSSAVCANHAIRRIHVLTFMQFNAYLLTAGSLIFVECKKVTWTFLRSLRDAARATIAD